MAHPIKSSTTHLPSRDKLHKPTSRLHAGPRVDRYENPDIARRPMSDTTRTQIYGLDLDLYNPEGGGFVSDVVVIARSVYPGEDGKNNDSLLMSSTDVTTGLIQEAMIGRAIQALDSNYYMKEVIEDDDDEGH